MSYVVIKTVSGRRYLYLQRSYRQGGRVRTESRYIGPADGGVPAGAKSTQKRKSFLQRLDAFISANRLSPEERIGYRTEMEMLAALKNQKSLRTKPCAEPAKRDETKPAPTNATPIASSKQNNDLAKPADEPATENPAAVAAGPVGSE